MLVAIATAKLKNDFGRWIHHRGTEDTEKKQRIFNAKWELQNAK
jgi:hypothetical protein